MPTKTGPVRSRLIVEAGPSDNDFNFPLNPETVDRDRAAQYADVPIALDEAGRTSDGLHTQWTRNQPEMLHVDFALYAERQENDIEADLNKLDRLMDKDARTGEPATLLFIHGVRTDRVRLISKSVKDQKRYTTDGRMQSARVTLTLKVLRQRV